MMHSVDSCESSKTLASPDEELLAKAINIVTHPVLYADMQGTRLWAWQKLMAARGNRIDAAQLKAFSRRSQIHSVQFGGRAI
jgi:hypothetical protein